MSDDAIGRWPLEKAFPATLRDTELRQVLGLSAAAFYKHKARGEYRALELDGQRGNTLYSGALVKQWVQTGVMPTRYFASARRTPVVRTGRPGRPRTRRVSQPHTDAHTS